VIFDTEIGVMIRGFIGNSGSAALAEESET